MKNKLCLIELCIVALAFFTHTASAQKLPNIQQISVYAPANVKVDGKPTEWDGQLQAYNNNTNIYYTLANDNENLYFIAQAPDQETINRIVGGGITLNIYRSGKKKDKDVISITYPVTDGGSTMIFNFRGRKNSIPDTTAKAADSVVKRSNATLGQKAKWIRTAGIAGLDTLTSVYNDDGIKAAGLFNIKKVYTLEMSVKLKQLGITENKATKFAYQVRVNGVKPIMMFSSFTPAAGSTPEQIVSMERMIQQMSAAQDKLSAPTDFWGEYTLAKKL